MFRDAGGRFCGMASPDAIVDRWAAKFPLCATFLAELRKDEALDIKRETDHQLAVWATTHIAPNEDGPSRRAPVSERLVARCISVDSQGLTMAQVQQIVESPLTDVPSPSAGCPPQPARVLEVVDRDSFALELAREWVRTSPPRNPVR